MFDIDAKLEADDMTRSAPNAPKCSTYRSIYPQSQAGAGAYTGEIDESIIDSHLQHGLKTHPST